MFKKILFGALLSVLPYSSTYAQEPTEPFTPEGVLAEGVDSTVSTNPYTGESGQARKGTVAATLNNIALLNGLLSEKTSPENELKIQKIIDAITPLIPSLRVIGVFDLFTVDEWLLTDAQPGRILVAALYIKQYPQTITPQNKQRLLQIRDTTKIKILSDTITKALIDRK
ncbi:MAG: hypothetical protein K0R73_187 [Candidatus Midichloriaceae bacterium]|jgi:hypothetical protein|nr:hypothetical protein [Candidatus Midichloriaceae bacterium]